MKQMQFSGMRKGGVHGVMVDKDQAFCLAFSALGKNIDNITTEAIKAFV